MKFDENLKSRKTSNKKMTVKIGILGAPINNGNMGCIALTYSLLAMLEELSKDIGVEFIYYDFEGIEDQAKTNVMCENLGIEKHRVKSFFVFAVETFWGVCHRPITAMRTYAAFKKCDIFIDLTEGDSFADIYGTSIFNKNANGKLLVGDKLQKPLILGPQTYGPYKKPANKKKAKRVLETAALVIARDEASAEYIKSFTDKKIYTTTDLAFRLPYRKSGVKPADMDESRIKVGVNISGLLLKNKLEGTPTEFTLKTDYDAYIDKLLTWLIDNDYKVNLIPHVVADHKCGKIIAEKYPQVELVKMYQNPMDIKSRISECDIFIGARMHATISAFSSGVATIPTAYSRKFNGLYESVGYTYIVDLLNDSTDENIEKTKEYVKQYYELKSAAQKSIEKINVLEGETMRLLKEQISILTR